MTTMEPAPEQFAKWLEMAVEKFPERVQSGLIAGEVARLAYAAGADAELEMCCEAISTWRGYWPFPAETLRTTRRPKPPSLKQQAQELLQSHEDGWRPTPSQWGIIRRAIDSLPDDTCACEE
jgi:hypothetical protein